MSDNEEFNCLQSENIVISPDKLIPFQSHPFSIDTESSDFKDLLESIQEYGILSPVYVRKRDDGDYEILSGHRRTEAAKVLGIDVPVSVYDVDDFMASIIMTHTNTTTREKILPSEKAKAYKLCMDFAKHQGKAGDDTAAMIGGEEDSKRQVYRYIRLSYLNDDLLDKVDDYKIRTSTGVELSYLDDESQEEVLRYMEENEVVPLLEQAKDLRQCFEENGNSLSYMDIDQIFNPTDEDDKPKKKTKKGLSIKRDELNEYFSEDTDIDEIKRIVLMLLDKYRSTDN